MSDEKHDAEVTIAEAVARVFEVDPHSFSQRPCSTCMAITTLLGRPFGCDSYRLTGRRAYDSVPASRADKAP